ncbi:hypothetical protein CAP48_00400 [Advenella sp. S44]|uniref:TetR/AcrR family transcriptional regulator n=1 Tax=Advenella sp. S44 TaxID=1982755 RepID=UPI000C29A333|nr:TetR/AcrR family transcriptional regulator [Advenella sp. S44]PJX27694.1 hypothetical protein CAP48_00400 [Advenella sp. S44]
MTTKDSLRIDNTAASQNQSASNRRTQAERRELSEQKILMAAMELVAEKGAYAVTLAEIGERAGFSRGLPAHKFGNKSNLLKSLAQFIAENFSVFSRDDRAPKLGIRRLELLADAYLLRDEKDWLPARALIMLTTEAHLLDNNVSDYMAQYNRIVLSYISKNIDSAVAMKDLKADCNSAEVATFLLSVFRGATLLRINDENIDLHGLHDQVMFYLKSIRRPPEKKRTQR